MRARSSGNHPDASTSAVDIMANDPAQAGGIYKGNIGQVEDVSPKQRVIVGKLQK